MSNKYEYRDLSGLTRILVVLLSLGILVGVVSTYPTSLQLALLNRSDYSEEEGDANDARQQAVGWMGTGLNVVTVVCFIIWIVRANRNARALGAKYLPITPGWAAGYF